MKNRLQSILSFPLKHRLITLIILVVLVSAGVFVEKTFLGTSSTFYGNVDIRSVDLGFRVFGRIKEMKVEEGVHVKKGDALAELETDTFEQQVLLQKAAVIEAKAAFGEASKNYVRFRRLLKGGAVAKGALEKASLKKETAQSRLDIANARLKLAQTQQADTLILAPNDGTILSRVREEGAIISPGATVYTLSLDSPVWVRAYADEPMLGKIHPGQKATILTDSDTRYKGHIGYISSLAEFTPKTVETTSLRTDLVYRFRIVVDNPDKKLRQGMPVTIQLNQD